MTKLLSITGKALSGEWGTDDETGEGIPVLRTANFTNEGVVNYNDVVTRIISKKNIEEKYLRKGDIIIEKSGGSDKQPVGRVIYFEGAERTYLFNNFTGLLRVKDSDKWNSEYVFYSMYANYLRGGTRQFENRTTGLHNLQIDAYISSFNIREISIDVQNEICKNLRKVRNIISLRKQELEEFDNLIKSRFVEMFGDPINNPNRYKKEAIEKHIDLLSGYPFKSEQYVDSGVNICGGLVIMPQRIKWEECVHWSSTEGYEDYMLNENDIVIALDRPWISDGFKIAKVDSEHLPALLIQRTARIRALDINQEYLYYCFIYGDFDRHSNVTGSLVPHISAKDIRSFEVLLPPIELQNEFADFVASVNKSKFEVQKSLDKTQLLMESLMQKYFG